MSQTLKSNNEVYNHTKFDKEDCKKLENAEHEKAQKTRNSKEMFFRKREPRVVRRRVGNREHKPHTPKI